MSRRSTGLAALVLALGLCVTAPRAVRAQTPAQYVAQLQGYMNNYAPGVMSGGLNLIGSLVTGGLAQGASASQTVTLTGGGNYAILGVCDADCSDVDLLLYGPDGSSIASDVLLDDHPTLRFMAPVSGSYRLQVNMATCRQAPCYYGVQLFGRASAPMPMAAPTSQGAPNPMGMIGANQQVSGNLTTMDARYDGKPIQAWGFQCSAGQAFQMDILSTWDNYALLFDPMGNVAARDDDTGEGLNARINYTCPTPGMYRLAVTTYTASTVPGPYTLQVQAAAMMAPQPMPMTPQPMPMAAQPMPMAAQPMPMTVQPMAAAVPAPGATGQIAIGQTLTGRLEAGDQRMSDSTWADVWQFQGIAGQSVTIELRSEEFDTYVQLLDASGTRLAEDDDSLGNLDSRVVYRLPATGAYQIVVNNFGDSRRSGTYTLTLR